MLNEYILGPSHFSCTIGLPSLLQQSINLDILVWHSVLSSILVIRIVVEGSYALLSCIHSTASASAVTIIKADCSPSAIQLYRFSDHRSMQSSRLTGTMLYALFISNLPKLVALPSCVTVSTTLFTVIHVNEHMKA